MTNRELMEKIYDKVCTVETDVSTLKTEMKEVKADICGLKTENCSLSDRITSLEMTLENETNRNIRIIAEGHMDLVRKLDEAIAVKKEREMVLLRMNVLENDMRIVKSKVGIA